MENLPMWVNIPGMDREENITAIFTTRHGGVSSAPYDTLNFSLHKKNKLENVLENFRRLSEKTGIPMDRMVLSKQVHGSTVSIVDKRHCGMGLTGERTLGDTDGLITGSKGVALVTFYADCVPVYLYDKKEGVIGLVHSGWRSTIENISAKAVEKMKSVFNCKPENITAAIGPHINKCCFEIGDDVYREFVSKLPFSKEMIKPSGEKWKADLSGIIARSLILEGIDKCNIHDIKRCTVCEKELFFSHRGGHGNSGTAIALFMMAD
ncbi:MAG: peptidoglycan editing factor PgeF [Clostridiaceae bacterium]|nr:peptidoglycan editing factor PgeF [Clostridiaceae bacterium]